MERESGFAFRRARAETARGSEYADQQEHQKQDDPEREGDEHTGQDAAHRAGASIDSIAAGCIITNDIRRLPGGAITGSGFAHRASMSLALPTQQPASRR